MAYSDIGPQRYCGLRQVEAGQAPGAIAGAREGPVTGGRAALEVSGKGYGEAAAEGGRTPVDSRAGLVSGDGETGVVGVAVGDDGDVAVLVTAVTAGVDSGEAAGGVGEAGVTD